MADQSKPSFISSRELQPGSSWEAALLLSLTRVAPCTPKLSAEEGTDGSGGAGLRQFMPCEMEQALPGLRKTGRLQRKLSEQLSSAVNRYNRLQAQRVLLGRWLPLRVHSNTPPNRAQLAHSLLLLQGKSYWSTEELLLVPLKSDTLDPDRKVTSLMYYLPNPKKNFQIKISLYQLRGACERNHMPLPARTPPAPHSNKGRLVSHPVSANPPVAITNLSFDVQEMTLLHIMPHVNMLSYWTVVSHMQARG